MNMLTPILATKLYLPSPRPQAVPRPRLIERLNKGLRQEPGFGRPLTLLSAPAGFGKTTLLSAWLHDPGITVDAPWSSRAEVATPRSSIQKPQSKIVNRAAWLALDAEDDDPARLMTYVVAALQTVAPNVGAGVLVALQSPQPPPAQVLLTALLNEIAALANPVLLVLDDCHVLEAEAVMQVLAFLLEHLPPQMHLVLATREDPPLPLARLRARGQLVELRAADLRFTPDEAADFLNRVMGLGLSAEDVAALESRTEGWIAGLQLAALALQGTGSTSGRPAAGFIQAFTGSHRFVLDYLVEEVLSRQPAEIQDFMLKTSLLERMTAELCGALLQPPTSSPQLPTSNLQPLLDHLDRANLFLVPLDDERRWYRYHHLFGELLRQRLGQNLAPGEIAGLHIRASEWYENNGLVFEAFRHATAANDVERAERLTNAEGMPMHFRGVAAAVLDWLASLPSTVLDARPTLWVKWATLSLVIGQTTGVEERLQAAEAALPRGEPDGQTRNLLGIIAAARATLALTRYQPEAMMAQARRALDLLHADNLTFRFTAFWVLSFAHLFLGDRAAAARASAEAVSISQASGDPFSTILARGVLGQVQELENQLYLAAETYRHALELEGDPPLPIAAEAHLGLARIFYQWNDLDAAARHGRQSLHLAHQYDRVIDRFILAEVFLARLKLAQGDVGGAAAALAQTEESVRRNNFFHRLPEVAAAQILVLLYQGKLEAAARLAQAHHLPLEQARVLLAQGDPSAALAVLEPLRRQAEEKGWADERLKVLVLQSVALNARGEKDQAVQVLSAALGLAEAGGCVRLFLDEGTPMRQLLQETVSRGKASDYARRLLAAFAPAGPKRVPQSALVEPLSERELEVLQLLAKGLRNRQIADRLYLSINTVKVHARNIYGKLGANNRTEAVARARELGVLPQR